MSRYEWTPEQRLAHLFNGGSRFVVRDREGTWGVAASTLPILLLRLRGEQWGLNRFFRIGKGGTVAPVSSGEVVAAAEESRMHRDVAVVR